MVSSRSSVKFSKYFKKIDKNKDGTITRDELVRGIDKLFSSDYRKTHDIEEIISCLDQNQDGRI